MKNLTWQNPEQLFVAQELIKIVKLKCCGIKDIGDSKYYKEGHDPGENSIYKQFTYAKNVIQMNMDVTAPSGQIGRGNYYDDVTEGYNITPNFFIRGMVNPLHLNYIEAELEQEKENNGKPAIEKRWHHENRLFDRDTLFVLKYSINFLFVLSAYASGRVDEAYKNRIREKFKKNLIEELERKYHFYLLFFVLTKKASVEPCSCLSNLRKTSK